MARHRAGKGDAEWRRIRDELLNESLSFGLDRARRAVAECRTTTAISGRTRKIINATKLICIDTNCKTNSYIDRVSTLIGSERCSK